MNVYLLISSIAIIFLIFFAVWLFLSKRKKAVKIYQKQEQDRKLLPQMQIMHSHIDQWFQTLCNQHNTSMGLIFGSFRYLSVKKDEHNIYLMQNTAEGEVNILKVSVFIFEGRVGIQAENLLYSSAWKGDFYYPSIKSDMNRFIYHVSEVFLPALKTSLQPA